MDKETNHPVSKQPADQVVEEWRAADHLPTALAFVAFAMLAGCIGLMIPLYSAKAASAKFAQLASAEVDSKALELREADSRVERLKKEKEEVASRFTEHGSRIDELVAETKSTSAKLIETMEKEKRLRTLIVEISQSNEVFARRMENKAEQLTHELERSEAIVSQLQETAKQSQQLIADWKSERAEESSSHTVTNYTPVMTLQPQTVYFHPPTCPVVCDETVRMVPIRKFH